MKLKSLLVDIVQIEAFLFSVNARVLENVTESVLFLFFSSMWKRWTHFRHETRSFENITWAPEFILPSNDTSNNPEAARPVVDT